MPKSERDEILTALVCQFCSNEDSGWFDISTSALKDISHILGHVGRTRVGLHPAVASRGDAWKNFVQCLQYSVSFTSIFIVRGYSLNVRPFHIK